MKKIQIKKNELTLKDDSIVDFFEKEVTPHGTGAKIPCSSKYIGKKAYVIITKNEKEKKKSKKNNRKN
ncbi:MAG: DUF2080 family transposase-associated protein [Actinobacteria bacterium]|nr:DUF2080 family transposase-associated protein [Actinomycetota bacterium]